MFLPKKLLLFIRSLHIYLSMLALILLMFFAMTGFMMNHPDWFGVERIETSESKTTIPANILPAADSPVNADQLTTYLRDVLQFKGEADTSGANDDPIHIIFKSARTRDEIEIVRGSREGSVTRTTKSFGGLLSSLHKGADTGSAWKRVIDATSILLVLISITGLILWITLAKRRTIGLISLAACVVICIGVLLLAL